MTIFVDKNGNMVDVLGYYPSYDGGENYVLCQARGNRASFVMERTQFDCMFHPRATSLSTQEKLALYFSVFRGRRDVYAKSFMNDQGKIQYFPSYNYGWKQLPPEKRTFQPLTDMILKSHLRGETAIGCFPLLSDDSTYLLALDFDQGDWREAITVLRKVCHRYQIEVNVEISRSGNGAHIWFFFKESLPARDARLFGKKILSLAMQESVEISFDSFDRMFPNQDILSKGGLGNLIALPLQGEAYQKGCSVFVDDCFQPYENQWDYLQSVQYLDSSFVTNFIKEELGELEVDKTLNIELSNVIVVKKREITAKTAYYLKNMASFSNPEFYLRQAMRQPTFQIPERLYLFEETELELRLPRGLLQRLKNDFEHLNVEDRRIQVHPLKVTFQGHLTIEQELALADLTSCDNGLLNAETGFGKTVLGAALIAERKSRTIILVHNKQLLDQWLERLEQFLTFEEEEAIRYTPSGRKKTIGHVGQYGGAKKWRSKLVDIVMIQSLFKIDHVATLFVDYDMMIVDECHHVSASMFETVVAQFAGKYLYGLTATPERKNGHEPIMYQRIGDILHTAEKRQSAFSRQLQLRFTQFGYLEKEKAHSRNFIDLSDWIATDFSRNQMIVKDVERLFNKNRNVLILVNRIQHIEELEQPLRKVLGNSLYIISGKSKTKERRLILEQLKDRKSGLVLISTGKYIGEGFDLPQLDTLVLAAPFSWKNNLIQYAGRIHRDYAGKEKVEIIDYVDIHVPYLDKMFQKRQVAYRKMDYKILEAEVSQRIFYDSTYYSNLQEDFNQVNHKVIIVLSYVHQAKLTSFLQKYSFEYLELIVPDTIKNKAWINRLASDRIRICYCQEKIVTSLMILDDYIIWYGSVPLFEKVEDVSLLRLESKSLAKELVDSIQKHS